MVDVNQDYLDEANTFPQLPSPNDLWRVLEDIVICPVFTGALFEKDKESHRAWTFARDALVKIKAVAAAMKGKCEGCDGRRWILSTNDDHGLRVERCDDCSYPGLDDADIYRVAELTIGAMLGRPLSQEDLKAEHAKAVARRRDEG